MTEPTAGEITVRHCVVRVVRRGGWSWGPDPANLVQQAIDALPDLLADRFDEFLTGDGPDVEITEPVVLSVRWGRSVPPRLGVPAGFAAEPAPDTLDPPVTPRAAAEPADSSVDEPVAAARSVTTPAELFAELAERGELAAVLALLPSRSLRGYLTAVFESGAAAELPAGVLEELASELARRFGRPSPPRPVTPEAVAELVASLPRTASSSSPSEAASPHGEPAGRSDEVRVGSALPFLLVGPLARTGYLDTIGAALSGVGLLARAPLFAAALAYQVPGASREAVAAFAGLVSAPDLSDFATQVEPALPMLDAVLALSLCRGHDPADPLLIREVDKGLLLVDAGGMFPIAWSPRATGLLPHWEACGRPPVLVCDSPLPPATLRELATAGVRLITDVRPLRDDPLTRLPWRGPLWTNGAADPRLAAELPTHAGRLTELTDAVFTRPGTALDRSASLATSLALGMIAWTLWRDLETPHPVLALTRFADLEATIRFTPDAVRVRIPLGRRHADLSRGGLLTDVPNVVWLDGRTLTFSGG